MDDTPAVEADSKDEPEVLPIDATPQDAKNGAEEKKDGKGGFLNTAQSVLTFIVGSVALLTASGFIIVNTYLARYTQIHGYSIHPGQYVAASIGALLFLVFCCLLLAGIGHFIFFGSLTLLLPFLSSETRAFTRDYLRRSLSAKQLISTVIEMLTDVIRSPRFIMRITSLAFLIGLLITFSISYGNVVYYLVPHYFGGGAPIPISLVFKDAESVSAFGFTPTSENSRVAANLALLSELTDGILVYDTLREYAAIVKNDAIQGIIDANEGSAAAFGLVTATPLPQLQGTGEATQEATEEATQAVVP